MITLAGFVPGRGHRDSLHGLPSGEKITEELFIQDESMVPTNHPKIMSYHGRQMTLHELSPWIAELQHLLWQRDSEAWWST